MAVPSNKARCLALSGRTVLVLFLIGHARFAVAGTTATDAAFDCHTGCHRAFKPVCGKDGHTYSNACVATCQDVHIARVGPCPGEALLHPTNEHVVTGTEQDGSSSSSSTSSTAPDTPAAAATATAGDLLTQQHLDAFRHEGFRYTGQMRFTTDMPQKHSHAKQEQQHQQQPAGGATAAGLGLLEQQLQQQQAGSLRAVRVTREGHVYVADMEENVDRVLDTLIQRQKAADDAAAAAAEEQQQQQQHQHGASHAHALLHSLQQWQGYRAHGIGGGGGGAAGVGGLGGGGSKWARHTVITATSGPGEHALQPVLDATGAAAAAGFAVEGPAAAAPTATATTTTASSRSADTDNHQPQHQQGEMSSLSWTTRVLGGVWNDRRDRQKQQKRPGGKEEGGSGGGSVEAHRPVRRSLGIFDTDDRIDCPRTPTYPFTAVGQINVRDPSGNYVCSGTLVGPDVVLTAAHCVFNRKAQAFYKSLDFAPSRYRTLDGAVVNPFGVIAWRDVTLYQGYSSLATPDPNTQDIAVISLSQRIGSQAGWMGVFEPCSPYAPSRFVALTAGYPSDQPSGSCKTTQCVVVQEPCTDGYLYHKCDTASGQSGSPMYMMAMTAGRRMGPYVRGVHNIEWVQETPDGGSLSYINSAVGITPDHYRSILAWIGLSFTTNGTTPMGPALPPNNYMAQLSGSR